MPWATYGTEAGGGLRLSWPYAQSSAQKIRDLRQHHWAEWTALAGSGLGCLIGRGW